MKKYILMSMGAIVASFTFANAQLAASECGCYDAPIGKDVPKSNYVSKEYVDEKFAPIFQKLDAINSRAESLSKELANLNASSAGLSQKVADLEAALNSLKGSCLSACNAKLSEVEKNIAELKEKVEKRSAHMEKEVEKSMRK